MKRNETLESDAIKHRNKCRHPAHDDEQEQQHCSCSNSTAVAATAGYQHTEQQQKYMTGIYKYILVRRTAA